VVKGHTKDKASFDLAVFDLAGNVALEMKGLEVFVRPGSQTDHPRRRRRSPAPCLPKPLVKFTLGRMDPVNIGEAKTHLSALIERAEQGEDVVIAKAGRPVVRLVAIRAGDRALGSDRGRFVVPDDFDAPLPDAVLASFTGGKPGSPPCCSTWPRPERPRGRPDVRSTRGARKRAG